MQNCNEDIIFYVPVNSKLQHSPMGISHLNFPHPPFKHMLKCPISGSYKVIKRPFSLSIVKKKYAYWARFFRALSLQWTWFLLTFNLCLDLRNLCHDFDPRPTEFYSNSHPPFPYRAEFPTAILGNVIKFTPPSLDTQLCQMPQFCPVKVLMFLLDRYITHQELYTVLGPENIKIAWVGAARAFLKTSERSLT